MPKHFVLEGFETSDAFTSPSSGGRKARPPAKNRAVHSAHLNAQLDAIEPFFEFVKSEAEDGDAIGLTIEFEGFPSIELAFESLAREQKGIELRNVRRTDETVFATVFIPDGKLGHFETLITQYLQERKDRNNKPIDNQRLIDSIANIRAATLRSMWTDTAPFPEASAERLWWEAWLPVRVNRIAVLNEFTRRCESLGLELARGILEFPERSVVLVKATVDELQQSLSLLNVVAELRLAKETADFFDSLEIDEQAEWVDELLSRLRFADEDADVPHVCILDTGVNRGHPLLSASISSSDQHAVEPGWGANDTQGHGTQMAGLALLGNLTDLLEESGELTVPYRLESVKLLERDGGNEGTSRFHGYLTREAVARPEISKPMRARLYSLAVSSRDGRDNGRPSAWSSVIDGLAAGTDTEGNARRLIVVAAGNSIQPDTYPLGNSDDSIHDPGQSWNALTIGAYTNLMRITEPEARDFTPLATNGALSPHSTTSAGWLARWPMKPDVVFEGGNIASNGVWTSTMASLSLLTTDHEPARRLFTTADATSAATSLAARMVATLQSEYPRLRPETIRGLVVQSASWTPAMQAMYLPTTRLPNKDDYKKLVRHCGFGVPDLPRARDSIANSLSLIVESAIVPFHKSNGTIRTKEMHLHDLPWPRDELLSLGEVEVEMRVTLSYFVEPNPSSRDQKSQYRYQSHGLRFEVRRPLESTPKFKSRISTAVADEDEDGIAIGEDPGWLLGKNGRHRGSIHSDTWRGSAADLSDRGVLAVYPALGWWRTRSGQKRWDSEAPYSLVVSIRTPETGVDLYAAIANKIAIAIGGDD